MTELDTAARKLSPEETQVLIKLAHAMREGLPRHHDHIDRRTVSMLFDALCYMAGAVLSRLEMGEEFDAG